MKQVTVEELLSKIDIVDYISQFVDLEEHGGEFWSLSPFKIENTPSFSVRRETGTFYDFSSGLGGSLLTFIRLYKKCSRRDAINEIKKLAGYDGVVFAPPERLSATKCCMKYNQRKRNDKPCKPIILPDDYMDRFEICEDKLKIWKDEGISMETMRKFDVRYDSFNDQIVYPVRNFDGKIINVGYRVLDPKWKEKGMHKYGYRQSFGGTMEVIYGLYDNLDDIKSKHEVIIFEGCKSVLKAYDFGYKNCAALSTSHLSPRQMILLMKLGCNVVFMLDKEINIKQDHNIQTLKKYCNCYYYYDYKDLLEEKDSPVDKGKEVFNILYEGVVRYR